MYLVRRTGRGQLTDRTLDWPDNWLTWTVDWPDNWLTHYADSRLTRTNDWPNMQLTDYGQASFFSSNMYMKTITEICVTKTVIEICTRGSHWNMQKADNQFTRKGYELHHVNILQRMFLSHIFQWLFSCTYLTKKMMIVHNQKNTTC